MTLMSTRATQIAPDHVNALNSIDVIFSGKRDQKVRDAWHAALAHLVTDTTQPGWQERLNDLKVDLYREIGARVGYSFTTDYLKRQIYYPKYYGDMEIDVLRIRKALTTALTEHGLKILPGNVGESAEAPAQPVAATSQPTNSNQRSSPE